MKLQFWISAAALFILMSGTLLANAAPAPGDPRPDPNACKLVSNLDLEPLLFAGAGGTLDSTDAYPAPGMSTCRWEARPNDRAADEVPRRASLAFYHLANRLRAQAQLDRQVHHDTRPSLAITAGGDDAVARPSATIIAARHGADIAVLDASSSELDNPDQLEVRYLLDALALKAAGAQVKPPPWAKPGQVAAWAPVIAAGAVQGWTPSPRTAPAGAALLEPLIHGIKVVAEHRFDMMILAGPAILLIVLLKNVRQRSSEPVDPFATPRAGRRWPAWLGGALLALLIFNSVYGADVATALVDRFGTVGAAKVISSFATSTQYNRHDVIGYNVLIRTAAGQVITSQYQTDDFNVRGLGDATIYPEVGDVMTVRYLAHYPQDFVIRNDDQSPWARKLACARLEAWRSDVAQRVAFAPGDAKSRNELARAGSVERAADCPS